MVIYTKKIESDEPSEGEIARLDQIDSLSSKLAYVTIARMEKETNNQIKQLVEDKTNNIVASFTIIIITTILTGTPSSSTLL